MDSRLPDYYNQEWVYMREAAGGLASTIDKTGLSRLRRYLSGRRPEQYLARWPVRMGRGGAA